MHRAIQDYLCSERCEWMQKWPGMCVLNASQLHWTLETEELLLEKAGEAPAAMLERQVYFMTIADQLPTHLFCLIPYSRRTYRHADTPLKVAIYPYEQPLALNQACRGTKYRKLILREEHILF